MILVIGGKNQGKSEFVNKNFPEMKVINGFHNIAREYMTEGKSIHKLLDEIIEEADVIISDEIGCGIVPSEKFDRDWREETGRALCSIAERAEAVYRVTAGIALKIK